MIAGNFHELNFHKSICLGFLSIYYGNISIIIYKFARLLWRNAHARGSISIISADYNKQTLL